MSERTAVVYDVNVLINAVVGPNSTYPRITSTPPTTDNPDADCLSLAFDAEEFALFTSPHILRNTLRVLVEKAGVNPGTAAKYVETVQEIATMSGGAVIDPPRSVFDVTDFEDNLILDLVVAVDARILVSADTDLTSLNPWNGRFIMRPKEFVRHAVSARRGASFRPQSDPEVALAPDE